VFSETIDKASIEVEVWCSMGKGIFLLHIKLNELIPDLQTFFACPRQASRNFVLSETDSEIDSE
jgi:hypothetical protein